jgi:hypothetical protein
MLTGTLVMIAGFIPVGFAASSAGEYCFSLFAVVLIALLFMGCRDPVFPLTGTWLLPEKSDITRQDRAGSRADTDGFCAWRCATGSPPC